MKKKVEKRISTMIQQKKKISQDDFISIIADKWTNIDRNLCHNLVNSMKGCLELVIKNKGGTIDY